MLTPGPAPASSAQGAIALFRSLGLGATVLLNDVTAHQGVTGLARWIADEHVEAVKMTPSLVRTLVRSMGSHEVIDSLRIIELGGETLFAHDVRDLRRHLPDDCSVRNIIGASEIGIFATYAVPPPTPTSPASSPSAAPSRARTSPCWTTSGRPWPRARLARSP